MRTRTDTYLAAMPAHALANLKSVATAAFSGLLKVLRMWRNRREVMRLEDFTVGQLADIGLTRQDLDLSLSAPWHEDPSVRLAEKARASRLVPFDEKI